MKQFARIMCMLFVGSMAWGAFTCPADPTQPLQYTPWALLLSPGPVTAVRAVATPVHAPISLPANAFGLLVFAVVASRRLRPARFRGSRRGEFAVLLLLAGAVPALLVPADLLAQPAPPVATPVQPGFSAVGTFRALPGGVLTYSLSIVSANLRTHVEGTGRYTLDTDCSGGTLLFNNNIAPLQLQFRFTEDFNQMFLATDSVETGGLGAHPKQFGLAKPGPAFCPAGITNTADLLNNSSWAVQGAGTLSAGIIRLMPSGNVEIFKNYFESRSNISMAPGCGGGSLVLGPLQLDFVYSGRFDEMFVINTTTQPDALPFATGTARLLQPSACPANPAMLLQGSPWAFRLETPAGGDRGAMAVGTFKAFPGGVLQVEETTQTNGTLIRGGQYAGRYTVDPDCSGGSLSFMGSALPVQLDFVFTNPDEILFATNSQRSLGPYSAAAIAATNTGGAKRTAGACPAGVSTPTDLLGGIGSILTFGKSATAPVGQLHVKGLGDVQIYKSYFESRSNISVAPDCGGGSLTLGPIQWDFVVAGVNLSDIYFLGNTLTPGGVTPSGAAAPIMHCPCPIGNKSW